MTLDIQSVLPTVLDPNNSYSDHSADTGENSQQISFCFGSLGQQDFKARQFL